MLSSLNPCKITVMLWLCYSIMCLLVQLGYEGAPSFPVDFAKYVHDLLNNSHMKERPSATPIVLS